MEIEKPEILSGTKQNLEQNNGTSLESLKEFQGFIASLSLSLVGLDSRRDG